MASTLSRLRRRQCIQEDADLLNSNTLRSPSNPAGVSIRQQTGVIVLARTNATVRALNRQKASAQAMSTGSNLATSHALDRATVPMNQTMRSTLLSYDGGTRMKASLGRLPLLPGMPVVYRGGNNNLALGVTNGAFATVVSWDLIHDRWGCTIP
ncbi:unnamed protein product, partial [Tilletia caries]